MCFLFFSPVSTVVLEAFNCDSDFDDGQSYLRADYSISCITSTYMAYRVYAIVMLIVYQIGIPLFCFRLLFVHRDELRLQHGQSYDALSSHQAADDVVSKLAEVGAAIQTYQSFIQV